MQERNNSFDAKKSEKTDSGDEIFSAFAGSHLKSFVVGCTDQPAALRDQAKMAESATIFHNSVANIVAHSDINTLAALQYAVEILRVGKIIVCGHYECSAVKLSIHGCRHEFLGNWLATIGGIKFKFAGLLDSLGDSDRINALCELNVIEQSFNLCRTTVVKNAWQRGRELSVYGMIYDPQTDFPVDLNIYVSDQTMFAERYAAAISDFKSRWNF
jgi:carbonic anhydrase